MSWIGIRVPFPKISTDAFAALDEHHIPYQPYRDHFSSGWYVDFPESTSITETGKKPRRLYTYTVNEHPIFSCAEQLVEIDADEDEFANSLLLNLPPDQSKPLDHHGPGHFHAFC